jgi:hypothetical protein
MKHILNDISQEEKNSILEKHTGGKKLMIENFNNLVNNKLGTVKTLINEELTPDERNKEEEEISELIVNLFKNQTFWKDYKGINDDEEGALKKYDAWWKTDVQPRLNKLGHSNNTNTILDANKRIRKALLGNESSDKVSWMLFLWGGQHDFEVDTDF